MILLEKVTLFVSASSRLGVGKIREGHAQQALFRDSSNYSGV